MASGVPALEPLLLVVLPEREEEVDEDEVVDEEDLVECDRESEYDSELLRSLLRLLVLRLLLLSSPLLSDSLRVSWRWR